MTMEYQVLVNNSIVKSYTHWIQAVTYCIMNGYVYTGQGTDRWNYGYSVTSLDPRVEIRRIKREKTTTKNG